MNPISAALKFVKGAVAKQDHVPVLQKFRIKNGRVLGFNGTLAISSPIEMRLDVAPKALDFVKAIDACGDSSQLTLQLTDAGKLCVSAKGFRSFVECDDCSLYPDIQPSGIVTSLDGCQLLPAFAYLEKFIADDDRRPWSCSILLDRHSAYASNNVVILQYWLGPALDLKNRLAIPSSAVRELLRIGVEPAAVQYDSRSITFHFKDSRWIRTAVIESPWPDVERVLDQTCLTEPWAFTEELFGAIEKLFPFTDELNRVYFLGNQISTLPDPKEKGTTVKVVCPDSGIFSAKQLLALRGVADRISFNDYPASVPFWGKLTRGRISPMR